MGAELLRLAHRKTIEESTTSIRILELLFLDDNDNIDPSLSLYKIDANGATVTQIMSEHSAFSEIDPPAKSAVNLDGLLNRIVDHEDDGGNFSFRRRSHFVLRTDQDRTFYELVADGLLKNKNGRFWSASASQIKEYGKRKYVANDPEWLASALACGIVMKWASKASDPQRDLQAISH